MNRSRHRTGPLAGLLCAVLLAGCAGSHVSAPAPDPEPAAPPVVEPTAEPDPVRVLSTSPSNVREGPGTDHPVDFWIEAATEVTVLGRNADGTWLRIEYEGREGWLFAGLTDFDTDVLADLPATVVAAPEPTPEPQVVLVPTATPVPPAVPEPDPEPATAPEPDPVRLTVTGNPVNLREGPGTGHPIALQAAAGDQFEVVARNADGSWLQVADPRTADGRLWIYGPLTDASGELVAGLVLAEAPGLAVQVDEPEPRVAQPAPEPAPPPAQPVAGCTQFHTVNPNETRLAQITDWFGLDLAAVAELNGIDADTPLTAGAQLCLAAGPAAQPRAPEPASPAPKPGTGGASAAPIGISVNSPLGYIWHAPGTYARSKPGLDYEFELVFSDHSDMWDWRIRDFEACYDALRVHMGGVPAEVGLQRMELRLADPMSFDEFVNAISADTWVGADMYDSPWVNPVDIPWTEYPNWSQAALPHPDLGVAAYGCFHQPQGQALCDIMPMWGHSHDIYLNAATALTMANSVARMSDNALGERYNRLDARYYEYNAYLFPLLDNLRGDPAGHGPCADVWRAK